MYRLKSRANNYFLQRCGFLWYTENNNLEISDIWLKIFPWGKFLNLNKKKKHVNNTLRKTCPMERFLKMIYSNQGYLFDYFLHFMDIASPNTTIRYFLLYCILCSPDRASLKIYKLSTADETSLKNLHVQYFIEHSKKKHV